MDSKLMCQALIKFFTGLLIVGILLFIPAGTISYWQAWLQENPGSASQKA